MSLSTELSYFPPLPQSAYTTQVTEALVYLETRLDAGISSNYSLCLVTYALALSGRPGAASAWDALLDRAHGTGATFGFLIL